MTGGVLILYFFFFNDTATTEIYTLSLHDALPISLLGQNSYFFVAGDRLMNDESTVVNALNTVALTGPININVRSEEHTSELQSRLHLVCRLLLEKKKTDPLNQVDST